jgi:hypothetical protein
MEPVVWYHYVRKDPWTLHVFWVHYGGGETLSSKVMKSPCVAPAEYTTPFNSFVNLCVLKAWYMLSGSAQWFVAFLLSSMF